MDWDPAAYTLIAYAQFKPRLRLSWKSLFTQRRKKDFKQDITGHGSWEMPAHKAIAWPR